MYVPRFYDLTEEIQNATDGIHHSSETSFNRARVVEQAPWFSRQEVCKDRCCAARVAISLDQDDKQIVNTMDGMDLADVAVKNGPAYEHLRFHADVFNEDILPCLQPGTIIHLNNNGKVIKYFWTRLRPNISVPFVLITSNSDADSPFRSWFADRLEDPLLMKWYGMNPKHSDDQKFQQNLDKFEPMPLGLSAGAHQSKYLSQYLELTNYTNPFLEKDRWTAPQQFDWKNDTFVFFGLRREHRQKMWNFLCPDSNATNSISCSKKRIDPSEIYASASQFRFGISPPGAGWDCYRTYELLLLGVIPVIDERRPEGHNLFQGLPVVHMPNMLLANSTQQFQRTIQNYLESEDFKKSTFQGWERLFLKYWRRKILQDANRDIDIVKDEQDREYYLAWRYTSKTPKVYCSEPGNCLGS